MNDRALAHAGAVGVVAWSIHHRRAKAAGCETKTHKESAKP